MSARSTKTKPGSHTNWKKLSKSDDSDIDYSDIPQTDESFWQNAELWIPSPKIPLSVRFDKDVVEYFKNEGKGYQSRMNAVLKSYVYRDRQLNSKSDKNTTRLKARLKNDEKARAHR